MQYPDVSPVTLRGEGLVLRELSAADAPAAFAWASDPEFFRYMGAEPMQTEAEEEAYLRDVVEHHARQRPRVQYHLGIVRDDTLIGIARLGIATPEQREGDIGYGLRQDYWRQGIATAAATLLLDFGFGQLGLHRIFAYHDPRNVASGRVQEKLGMRREGELRENMLVHGAWRNSVVRAILEDEWTARLSE